MRVDSPTDPAAQDPLRAGDRRPPERTLVDILRATVAACRVPVSSPTTLRVTVSIGLASARRGETCLDTLLAQADHAMYRAKHAGKNTVVGA